MDIVMLGRPGSGKGTQSSRLAATLGLRHLSTGDLLRSAIASGSEVGRSIDDAVAAGALVDDAVVERLLAEAVASRPGGVLLDGYPRTIAQCLSLPAVLGLGGASLAVELDVPAAAILHRVRVRGRADDRPDVVLRRLFAYEQASKPVADWFARRGLLVSVAGTGSVDEVASRVAAAVNHRLREGCLVS
jgi:adenylate kinase